MIPMINVADMKNPETGLTYRQENLMKTHSIPIGSLVEITYNDEDQDQNEFGLRLFVKQHIRDCDGTPLYALTSLTPYRWNLNESVSNSEPFFMNGFLSSGHSEESLKLIRLPDGEYPKPELLTGFIVSASTGCTCQSCQSDKFTTGIYDTLEEAMTQAEGYVNSRRLRSQYSNTGIYYIREIQYEQLSDGRIIIENRVFEDKTSLYEFDSDAGALFTAGKSHGFLGTYIKGA